MMRKTNATFEKSPMVQIKNSIKSEIHTLLRDLNMPEDVVRNCDVDTLIKNCLLRNGIIIDCSDEKNEKIIEKKATIQNTGESGIETNMVDESVLIKKNLEKLQQRLTVLEQQFLMVFPRTSEAINTMPANLNLTKPKPVADSLAEGEVITQIAAKNAVKAENNRKCNVQKIPNTYYEDPKIMLLFQNQIDYNLLKKKKSSTSMGLNLRPALNNLAAPSPQSVARYIAKFHKEPR